jgi:PKD repeat protein
MLSIFKKTLVFVIALSFVSALHAETFNVTGNVINQTTNMPVTNHDVQIYTAANFPEDTLTNMLLSTIQTNDEGVFSIELTFNDDSEYYIVSTVDLCLNENLSSVITTANADVTVNFETCFPEEESTLCNANFHNYTDSISSLTIHFLDQSEGTIIEWLWDFGDGSTSDEQNPIHSFQESGNYNVSLTAKTQNIEDTYSFEVYVEDTSETVEVNDTLSAYFYTYSDSSENILTVSFYEYTNDQDVSRLWDFGDDNTSTTENPLHTYDTEGTYMVTLTVTNNDEEVSYSQEVTVPFIQEVTEPIINEQDEDSTQYAYFSYYYDSINTSSLIIFQNYSNGEFTEYNWDFGDGDTSNEENPQHAYITEGEYQVILTALSNDSSYVYSLNIYAYTIENNIAENSSENTLGTSTMETSKLKVYPTIVENELTLELSNSVNSSLNIAVYRTNGSIIYNSNVDMSSASIKTTINLSHLEKGNYIMLVNYNSTTETVRFIKE